MNLTKEQLAQLAEMDHAALYQARSRAPAQMQGLLSPYEHRAFAREATQENPLMALPIAAGTLAYQPYKALMGARSAPSFDQVGQGLLGVGEGLARRLGLLAR
jgi:hypothetical protein